MVVGSWVSSRFMVSSHESEVDVIVYIAVLLSSSLLNCTLLAIA